MKKNEIARKRIELLMSCARMMAITILVYIIIKAGGPLI